MKLAEALFLRSDLQKRQEQLSSRIDDNLMMQEGDTPAEDPHELLKQYENNAIELCALIRDINHTNIQTMLGSHSLTHALAERDRLTAVLGVLRKAANKATVPFQAYSRSEIRFVPTMEAKALRRKADGLAKELRELELQIQALNWTTELISG